MKIKLKTFLETELGKMIAIAVIFLVSLGIAGGCYWGWIEQQAKFQDVTVELGSPVLAVDAFYGEYTDPQKVQLVTQPGQINLMQAGTYPVTFRYGKKTETVTLTVEDTVAPAVMFRDVSITARDRCAPEDFVESVTELAGYTVRFGKTPVPPEDHTDAQVQVIVTDDSGNTTEGTCVLHYQWIRPEYTMELGEELKKSALLYRYLPEQMLILQEELDAVNTGPAGVYTVQAVGTGQSCQVTVQDTTAPSLVLQDVAIMLGETAALEDFVVSAADLSGDVELRLVEELPLTEPGTHAVTVEAEDIHGNVTTAQANLQVTADTTPPEFYGVGTMYVEKHTQGNYSYGVSAVDARDGRVPFTVDDSRVDTSRAGTYYVIYTATDSEGNVATYRRAVVVPHNEEDTAALVKSIAAGLSSDPEAIRNYVRDYIWYSSNWGGDDPVWYGFNSWNGNCYVHALCMKVLLDEKGIANQLIWVEDQSHYWLLVNIGGTWKHMDPTPGVYHERYSIMNDAQRYETLSGRDWDRDAWPAVP